ncbi:MAG: PaaI family thioesterase [Deltaproteobacteria bacterium]|nr:PaaI family thioesterase [Deltaproteobacteria bacterium]
MKQLNPDHVAAIKAQANNCPYFNLLSMKIDTLEIGRSFMEVDVQDKHLQPYGIVHGGVYASLIDAAAFWAAYASIDTSGLTTVEMKLNFLAPAASGRFIAKGKIIKAGKTICLSEATVFDHKEKILAHGTSTLMIRHSLELGKQASLPPKYLAS